MAEDRLQFRQFPQLPTPTEIERMPVARLRSLARRIGLGNPNGWPATELRRRVKAEIAGMRPELPEEAPEATKPIWCWEHYDAAEQRWKTITVFLPLPLAGEEAVQNLVLQTRSESIARGSMRHYASSLNERPERVRLARYIEDPDFEPEALT